MTIWRNFRASWSGTRCGIRGIWTGRRRKTALMQMRYRDYIWPHNPEALKIGRTKLTGNFRVPHAGGVVQDLGCAGRTVTGSGRFIGEDCLAEFGRLSHRFAQEGSGLLCLPGAKPFFAVFRSLSMTGTAGPDCVRYEFEFQEDGSVKATESVVADCRSYTCKGGETLWQVAVSFGTDVDTLLAVNPEVEWPNDLPAGLVVTGP